MKYDSSPILKSRRCEHLWALLFNVMKQFDIRQLRLQNQHLSKSKFRSAVEVVQSLVAMQAQDYHGAKWGIGLRLPESTDNAVEKAINDGEILRLHVMRPTWHFVTAKDIRWLVNLTAPRVNVACRSYYRKLELDDSLFKKTNKVLVKALKGGKNLTRDELKRSIEQAGIEPGNSIRFAFIMFRAELDLVICSGAMRGNKFTYALVDERVPEFGALDRDEGLEELALRYFTTRGPATLADYVWWSGLTTTEAKRGIEIAGQKLHSESVEGKTYWLSAGSSRVPRTDRRAYLLPTYDEFLIAYTDRRASMLPGFNQKDAVFNATLLIDGQIVGSWKKLVKKNLVTLQLNTLATLTKKDQALVVDAATKYGDFLQREVQVK